MIIVIASQESGAGKTTIATNLAVIRAQNGSDILLLDADTKRTALDFTAAREEGAYQPEITCLAMYGKAISAELRKLSVKFDDIIVDIGSRDITTFKNALLIADVLVTPILPDHSDPWGKQKMEDLIEEAKHLNDKLRTITILNKVDAYTKASFAEELINHSREGKNLTFYNAYIVYRIAFRLSVAEGLAVTELNKKDQKAVTEIKQLYDEVFKGE